MLSIGYDACNQTGSYAARDVTGQVDAFRHLIIMILSHPMNEQVMKHPGQVGISRSTSWRA